MDKKTLSLGLIVLSVIAAALGAFDYFTDTAPLSLGADSWLGVSATLGVWGIFAKQA